MTDGIVHMMNASMTASVVGKYVAVMQDFVQITTSAFAKETVLSTQTVATQVTAPQVSAIAELIVELLDISVIHRVTSALMTANVAQDTALIIKSLGNGRAATLNVLADPRFIAS